MTLEKFVHNLTWEDIPERARNIARLCVLDAIGCAVAGSRSKGLPAYVDNVLEQCQAGILPIWGTRFSLTPGWATFFNAHTAAYFDMDDGHRLAQGHPGATIVPAALTAACQQNLSGKALLEAVVVGYEIAIRSALVIRSLGGPRKGSGGWAAVGAAAAVARLLGCSAEQILHAIGLAEYYAPQAPQDRSASFPSEMKEGIPWGACSGYTAALLASGGFSGMRPHLADSAYVADLGKAYEIENTYFKMYASCRWAHPALDGLHKIFAQKPIDLEDVKEIRVYTFEKALLMRRSNPQTPMEAVYSIPFAIGCFLVHGKLGPEQLIEENFRDQQISNLGRRVRLIADKDLTDRFPGHCLQRVEVDFKTGETLSSPLLSAKGDPDKPYPEEELIGKFKWLAEGVLGRQAEQIPALIKELERHPAANLVTLLKPR
jgi:2-methylcitrate dehydratase PrpD